MTAHEQITVQRMALKLDTHLSEFKQYVADDEKWKKNFTSIVTPLIKDETDRKVIHEYLKAKTYYFLKILGLLTTLITIIYYLIAVLRPGMQK